MLLKSFLSQFSLFRFQFGFTENKKIETTYLERNDLFK